MTDELDARLVEWSAARFNMSNPAYWRYTTLDVKDRPEVWNGIMHNYAGSVAPQFWNTYRSIRIMVSRAQEGFCTRVCMSPAEREMKLQQCKSVRRLMTDEVCYGAPACLGQAGEAMFNSPCVLVSAYATIWPLFFAGTSALERIWKADLQGLDLASSAASAQVTWVVGRLEYIARTIGLKWAEGIAAVLKGDFRLHDVALLPE